MVIRNLLVLALIPVLLASCATSHVGERRPDVAKYACPLAADSCSLNLSKDEWAFEGTYKIDRTDTNRFRVHGRVKVDGTALLSAYTHSRLVLTLYFFRSDEIVEEMNITVRGKVNRFSEFSKSLVTEENPNASIFGFSQVRVSEVPL